METLAHLALEAPHVSKRWRVRAAALIPIDALDVRRRASLATPVCTDLGADHLDATKASRMLWIIILASERRRLTRPSRDSVRGGR